MNNIEQFLKVTKDELIKNNVTINLSDEPYVLLPDGEKGTECNGYFMDEPQPFFAVGTGKDTSKWFPIYVHEYCHFTQWRDGIPEWKNLWIDGIYYDTFLDKLVTGNNDFSDTLVEQFINAAIDIESDCERRVVKLIKEFDLLINIKDYSQAANSYVHFYNYIKLYKKWYIAGKEPYNIKEVYSQFNKEIDNDFSLNIEYINLYNKYCF